MWIREAAPQNESEWEQAYINRLTEMLENHKIDLEPKEYLVNLGQKLFVKITEVIQSEVEDVSEQDCIEYIRNLVIQRTFDGYQREIETIYGQLQQAISIKVDPAPDQWDRGYNVDFYIEIQGSYIGLQIKPITFEQKQDLHKWKQWLSKTHDKFTKKYGGRVFTIFSTNANQSKTKCIHNVEIIDEIRQEIERLQKGHANPTDR